MNLANDYFAIGYAPEIPGKSSDIPIKIPAKKYLIFSFTYLRHPLIYLLTLEQMQHLQTALLLFHYFLRV